MTGEEVQQIRNARYQGNGHRRHTHEDNYSDPHHLVDDGRDGGVEPTQNRAKTTFRCVSKLARRSAKGRAPWHEKAGERQPPSTRKVSGQTVTVESPLPWQPLCTRLLVAENERVGLGYFTVKKPNIELSCGGQ